MESLESGRPPVDAARGDRTHQPGHTLSSPQPPAVTCTLLYIEDNEQNVSLVQHLLKLRPEWTLIHTPFGSVGLELALTHLPDLVLLDLHLPDGSGAAVLQKLNNNLVTSELPVVILTGDASIGQSRRLLDTGAALCLTKPLDVSQLLAVLDERAALRASRP